MRTTLHKIDFFGYGIIISPLLMKIMLHNKITFLLYGIVISPL